MSRRTRLLVRYWLVSGLVLAASVVAAIRPWRPDAVAVVPGDRDIAGLTDGLARRPPDDAPDAVFVDVSEAAGIRCDNFGATRSRALPEDMASGAAWLDYDGDDDLDLFVVRMEPLDASKKTPGAAAGHALFRNDGGTFVDVSVASKVGTPVHGLGAAPADFDGDGRIDLYVTCYGRNQLLRNLGDGTFADVASEAGVALDGFSSGAAWADYDGDGDLDLYVAQYVAYRDDPSARGRVSRQGAMQIPYSMNPSTYPPVGGRLYRNRGDGGFEDVTSEAGVGNAKGKGLGVAFTDLDGDGRPDIYVANDVSDNVYYVNRGGGRFDDVSARTGTADYRGAMGIAVGDFDGDADDDLFVTHWIAQENALYRNDSEPFDPADEASRRPPEDPAARILMYMDVADRFGLGAIALDFVGWGTSFFDYDLDGRLDLFVANGHTIDLPEQGLRLEPQRPLLFWNGGDRGFFSMGTRAGDVFGRRFAARGAAFGDYDGDGDEDVFVVVHGAPGLLLRNEQRTGHGHVVVRTSQSGMNRFAVGARVTVTAGGRSQSRTVGAQPSYLSGNAYDLVFGLGDRRSVERVDVTFPDGTRRTVASPTSKVVAVVKEDVDVPK